MQVSAKASKQPKVGLALSSGGARGAVHMGVIKVLKNADIPIDCLSGSSAGAIVAATYACGNLDKLENFLKKIKKRDILALFDPHLSTESFIKGKKALDLLRYLTDDKSFENLKIPVYVLASDIKSGKEIVFKKGRIAEALLASMSIPPLFKPVAYGDKLLVDGGLLHLLPVEELKKNHCDLVIASTIKVNKLIALERDGNIIRTYKTIKELTNGIKNGFSKAKNETLKIEMIQRILFIKRLFNELFVAEEKETTLSRNEKYNFLRAVMDCCDVGIASVEREEKMADLVIKTDVNGVKTIDLHKAYECIKRGEKQAEAELPKIKHLIASYKNPSSPKTKTKI